MSMKLTDQTVLITGGASGIGLALAKRFAARGNTVIVCGRDRAKLADAKSAIPRLITLRADVSDPAEREKLVSTVLKDFPGLSILVNNAGIQNQSEPMLGPQVQPTDWTAHAREIEINFAAPVHLSMLLLPHLAKQTDGAILNITSGLAFVPIARMPVYCATKAALHSFTESLRYQAKATSLRIIEVAPPAVNTDLGGKGLHDFGEPVDAYADDVFVNLEAGKLQFGYKFSEAARTADRSARQAIFERMNSGM
jgi:uncharacterized oxidoreductase